MVTIPYEFDTIVNYKYCPALHETGPTCSTSSPYAFLSVPSIILRWTALLARVEIPRVTSKADSMSPSSRPALTLYLWKSCSSRLYLVMRWTGRMR